MRRLNNHAGFVATSVAVLVTVVVGVLIITSANKEFIFEEIPSVNGTGNVASASSFAGLIGKASGEITMLSSIGDSWMVNFKDDLSDYKFIGVDTTELYLLQYAFEHKESVTVTYSVDGDVKNLEGVTMFSPEPPPQPVVEPVKKNDSFNWWLLIPVIATGISTGFLFSSTRRHRRRVERTISDVENQQRAIRSSPHSSASSSTNKKKKKVEEPKEKAVLPLDGRYRVEQAEALLGEKGKNKKNRKKKTEGEK